MKKWLSTLTLALVFLIAGSGAIHAQDEISLVVNGNKIETDAPCFIENNRTLVPIRFIGESLGYDVKWDNSTKQVTIINKKEDAQVSKIELVINSDKALVYGKDQAQKEVKLETPAKITNNRTFVPIRFIGESFGTPIDWDKDNRVVIVGDKAKYNPDVFAKLRKAEEPVKPAEKSSLKAVQGVDTFYMQDPNQGLFFIVKKLGKNNDGFTYEVQQRQMVPFVKEEKLGFHSYFVQDPKSGDLISNDGFKLTADKQGMVLTGIGLEDAIPLKKMDFSKTYKCRIGEWYFNDGALSFQTVIR